MSVDVYAWCRGTGSVIVRERYIAGNCHKILRTSLLLFNNMWLDFAKHIIASWAKQKMLVKLQHTLICHQITLSMTMRKTGNVGQWKDARYWLYNQTIVTFCTNDPKVQITTEGQLHRRVIIKCQFRAWMTSEVAENWLAVVWNRQPGVHLKNWVCWCWMPLRCIWHKK